MPIPGYIALGRTIKIKTQLIRCFISIGIQFVQLNLKRQANCLTFEIFTKKHLLSASDTPYCHGR
jgi:hypothetical protein